MSVPTNTKRLIQFGMYDNDNTNICQIYQNQYFLSQALKLEKILHDRNAEIDALKSRLTSELSCSEEVDVMNTPPPKVVLHLFQICLMSNLSLDTVTNHFRYPHRAFPNHPPVERRVDGPGEGAGGPHQESPEASQTEKLLRLRHKQLRGVSLPRLRVGHEVRGEHFY